MASNETFRPDWTLPPGATILDLLERRRIATTDFARRLGATESDTNCLLDGRHAVTQDTARKLEAILGAPATFWLNREAQYRDDLERLAAEKRRADERGWLSELPVADMTRLGWIPANSRPSDKLAACLQFFDVPDVATWRATYAPMLQSAAFKTSASFESRPAAVAAWVRQGELVASRIPCAPWDADRFRSALADIRSLTTRRDPHTFIPDLQRRCAECGVAVAVVRGPSGCRASGLTRFLSPTRALLLLSFRHLSDDHFWFAFFHEAGHLLLHSKNSVFVEGVGASNVHEDEANAFAARVLIPASFERDLQRVPLLAKELIRLAQRIGVSPGIIVGQLQHRGRLQQHQMSPLKRRFAWP